MIIERGTAEHFDDWVRLRQALWPDETIEEHRRYAASRIDRPKDAIVSSPRTRGQNYCFRRGNLASRLCERLQHFPGRISRGALRRGSLSWSRACAATQ